MKIYSINNAMYSQQSNRRINSEQKRPMQSRQPSFKSLGGKLVGGLLGAGLAGLVSIATAGVGGLAIVTFIASETGGAYLGAKAGDKLTGKDED